MSVAVTIADRLDASLRLIVMLGPRNLYSRPARLAGALPTVLLKSSAGAPAGAAGMKRGEIFGGRLTAGGEGPENHADAVVALSHQRIGRVVQRLPRDDDGVS